MAKQEKTERKPQIGFPSTDAQIAAVEEIRERTGITLAHMGREAIWEKIAEIRRTHPAFADERQAEPATASAS